MAYLIHFSFRSRDCRWESAVVHTNVITVTSLERLLSTSAHQPNPLSGWWLESNTFRNLFSYAQSFPKSVRNKCVLTVLCPESVWYSYHILSLIPFMALCHYAVCNGISKPQPFPVALSLSHNCTYLLGQFDALKGHILLDRLKHIFGDLYGR